MIELSIHFNHRKIYDSNEKKIAANCKKLYSMSILALMPIIESAGDMTQYYQEAPPVTIDDRGALQIIADFCKATIQFCKDVGWCISNPVNALVIFLEYFTPFILLVATTVPMIGIIVYTLKIEKFLGKTPRQLILNPILFYIFYTILIHALKICIA